MICFSLTRLRAYFDYRKWQKKYQIRSHIQNIENYFAPINGYVLSKQARASTPNLALTYGEIDLESFLALLSLVKLRPDSVFYDLGCGLGKTVIACANVYSVKLACGVEYLTELLVPAWNYAPNNPRICFLNQNILDTHWSDTDVLFLNVATFLPEVWENICQKMISHPTKTMITCGKALPPLPAYEVRKTQVKTSWGHVHTYIHTRKTAP